MISMRYPADHLTLLLAAWQADIDSEPLPPMTTLDAALDRLTRCQSVRTGHAPDPDPIGTVRR
jgi:hypothetical protein